MQSAFLLIILVSLSGCLSLFIGPGQVPATGLSGPPTLRVRFDSITAAAQISWQRGPEEGFLRYELERRTANDSTVVAVLDDLEDTTYVDPGLLGDVAYRYQVVTYLARDRGEVSLPSSVVEGGIHRRVAVWTTGAGADRFLPTRLVVASDGVISAVGVGSGSVRQFDGEGNLLAVLPFTRDRLACMEAACLDGPSLALDSRGSLYVVYNTRGESGPVQALWTKFDPEGRQVWTRPLGVLFARQILIDARDHVQIESVGQLLEFDLEGQPSGPRRLLPPLLATSVHPWTGRVAALVEPLQTDDLSAPAPRVIVYRDADRQETEFTVGRDPIAADDRGDGLLQRPADFCVEEGADRVFVLNAGFHRVEVFRRGQFLTRWGEAGEGPGQFRFGGTVEVVDDPTQGRVSERLVLAGGIARDREGFLYVADTFNDRIHKFGP